jgi:hypothetical protein
LKWSLAVLAAAAVVPFTVATGGHSFGAVSAAGSVWIAATDAGAVGLRLCLGLVDAACRL